MRRLALLSIFLALPVFGGETCTTDVRTCGSGSSGTVTGPAAACTDNAVVRWDGATTTAIQCSVPTISDLGAISGLTGVSSTSITDSGLTSGRVTFASTGGLLADDADMTFATDTLTITNAVGSTSSCGGGATGAANSVCVTGNTITAEGSAADANEFTLSFANPTADNTLTYTATATEITEAVTTGNFVLSPASGSDVQVPAGTGTAKVSLGGLICKGAPNAATTGTTEQVLATCTIPANTISEDGTTIRVELFAKTAANGNNKTLQVRLGGIGGTSVTSTGARALNDQNITTVHPVLIQRLSSTTATAQGWTTAQPDGVNQAGAAHGQSSIRSVSVTWANSNDIVITATTPTASGDLTLITYSVEIVQ